MYLACLRHCGLVRRLAALLSFPLVLNLLRPKRSLVPQEIPPQKPIPATRHRQDNLLRTQGQRHSLHLPVA